MNKAAGVILAILGLVIFIAIAFGLELGGLQWKKFFAPKRENIRRQVFEHTKSYNQAKLQELVKYRHEYMTTTNKLEKAAIASTVRLGFADYNKNELPLELQQFMAEIQYK